MIRCQFQYDTGGLPEHRGQGDCVCRSLSITSGVSYSEVAELIHRFAKLERKGTRKRGKSNPHTGVYKYTAHRVAHHLGGKWLPTMGIGTGCRVHLRADQLPRGRLVLYLSKHWTAVIDGVIHDLENPDRYGTRCVYGIWKFPEIVK